MSVIFNVCQRLAFVFITNVITASLLYSQSLDDLLPPAIVAESDAIQESGERSTKFSVMDLERVRFSGNKIHSDASIRLGLQTAIELIGELHSRATVESQIQAVVKAIRLGYDSSGVPLQIETGEIDDDGQSFSLEFKIEEGPQFVWGGVRVNCSDESLRSKIVRQLTQKTVSSGDMLVPSIDGSCMVGRKSGKLMTEWLDPSGATPNEKALIEKGLPASNKRPSFQADFDKRVKLAVEAAGISSMDFRVQYKVDDEHHNIFAEVDVVEIGVPLIISKVEFEGLSIHSDKQLQDFLEVHEGDLITEEKLLDVQRKLYRCGRFQWHSVRSSAVPGAPGYSSERILTISLQESDRVPRIDQPLDDNQKALLRLGNAVNHAFDLPGNELSIEYSGNFSLLDDTNWFTSVQKRKPGSFRFIVAKNSCSLSVQGAGSKDLLITLTDGTLELEGTNTSQRYRFRSEYLKYVLVGYFRGVVPADRSKANLNEEPKTTSLTIGAKTSTDMPDIKSICQFTISPFCMLREANRAEVSRKSGCLLYRFDDVFQIAIKEERDQLVGFQFKSEEGSLVRGRIGTGMIAEMKQQYRSKAGSMRKPEVFDLDTSPMKLIDLVDLVGDTTDKIVAKPGLLKQFLIEMSLLVPPIRELASEISGENAKAFLCSSNKDPRLMGTGIAHYAATMLFSAKSPQALFFRKLIQSELTDDLDLRAEAIAMLQLPELKKPSFALLSAMKGLDQQGPAPFNAFSGTVQFAAGIASSPKEFLMSEFSGYDQVGTVYTKSVSAILLRLGESESLKYVVETLESGSAEDGQFSKLLAALREDSLRTQLNACAHPRLEQHAAPERTAGKSNESIAR